MKRLIFSLISAVIIQIAFYSFIGAYANMPPWVEHWVFKLLLFIVLVWFIGFIWGRIWGANTDMVNRKKTEESMKLDKDVRQAILDRSRLAEQHLAETCGKLDSSGQAAIAEEARKARNMLESFSKTLSAQPTGPGPASAGLNISERDASRIVLHDKNILAIIEEIADDSADLATNVGSDLNSDKASIKHISEAARRLMDQIQTRTEILKGIK